MATQSSPSGTAPIKKIRESQAERTRRMVAEREAKQIAERQQALATNPLRLLQLMARAAPASYFDRVDVLNGTTDPQDLKTRALGAHFRRERCSNHESIDTILTVFSPAWEFEELESVMDQEDARREAERKRLELARQTWDQLSQDQREALGLPRRP